MPNKDREFYSQYLHLIFVNNQIISSQQKKSKRSKTHTESINAVIFSQRNDETKKNSESFEWDSQIADLDFYEIWNSNVKFEYCLYALH